MTKPSRGELALFGLVTFVTAIAVELISASGPLLDKPFNEGVIKVALVALGTYALPGILVAALLLVNRPRTYAPGAGPTLLVAVASLGVVRLLLQGMGGDVRFVIGLFGAALAVAVVTLVIGFAASRSAALTSLGFVAGAILAAAVSLLLGTWDAIWRPGVLGWGPTAILVAGGFVSAWFLRKETARPLPGRLWAAGPALAMLVMALANPAYLASQLGMSLRIVGVGLGLALLASALVTQRALRSTGRTSSILDTDVAPVVLLIGLFGVVLFPASFPGEALEGYFVAVMVFAIAALPAMLTIVLTRAWGTQKRDRTPTRTMVSWSVTGTLVGLGVILPLLLYQLDYDVPLPVPNAFVPLAAIVLVAATSMRFKPNLPPEPQPAEVAPARRGKKKQKVRPDKASPPAPAGLTVSPLALVTWIVVLVFVGSGLNTLPGARAGGSAKVDDEITLMNWNLHFGVTMEPGVDLDAFAREINDTGAQIITLQEVSRGWVMGGRADMATYLARATGKTMALAPAADRQFSNVILVDPELGPIEDIVRTALPYGDGPQWRSAITGTVNVTGASEGLTVTSTHLQHRERNTPTRLEQLGVLIDADLASGPAILAGDLNAQPGWPEIDLMLEAGYESAQDAVGDPAARTFPSWDPEVRIDWVWGNEVAFTGFEVLPTVPSDHRAMLTTFRITPEKP